MKNLFHIIAFLFSLLSGFASLMAQTPHLINYQAAARNTTTGQELAHQSIFVSIKILEAGPTGVLVYQENHDGLETNYLGLFNLFIGGGTPVSGSFDAIQWGDANYWLSVDIDAGQGLQSMGSMQFVAVPYALHAETVSQIDDADADPTNELVQDIDFNPQTSVFSLVQEGGILTQNLSALINDADADPSNELVQSIAFDSGTNIFSLTQEGGTLEQDLSSLVDDADADPLNEAITSMQLVGTNLVVNEVSNWTVSLSQLVNDADADPTNELVQAIALNEETKVFSLIQEGGTLTQDFSALINDADADPANELVQAIELNAETNVFSLTQEGGTLTQDLSALINDADADPTNELVESITFNAQTSIFSLTQEGGTLTQDLSALIDDADADPTNELVESITFNAQTSIFSLTQEGGVLTQDLSALIDDADADPTNELINTLTLVSDTILKIQEGPTGEITLNLAPLKRDENWTKLNTGSVTNIGSKVGIGTSTPASTFEVDGSVGYKVTLLENSLGAVSYSVSDTDHIIVCKVGGSSSATFNITMPDATSCPGRSITIRKTGAVPIVAQVVISFGEDMIEFGDGVITLGDFQRETVTFISLGSNGWTKL